MLRLMEKFKKAVGWAVAQPVNTPRAAMVEDVDMTAQSTLGGKGFSMGPSLDEQYEKVLALTEGAIGPIDYEIIRDDKNPALDRIITTHEVPYYLPNGDKGMSTFQIDSGRGLAGISDEDFLKENVIDAYKLYAEEVSALTKAINSPNHSMIQTATSLNAFAEKAHKEGIPLKPENQERIAKSMFKFGQ